MHQLRLSKTAASASATESTPSAITPGCDYYTY